jgi:hypothetical protein
MRKSTWPVGIVLGLIACLIFAWIAVNAGINDGPDGFPTRKAPATFFWTQYVGFDFTEADEPVCSTDGCATLGDGCPPLLIPGGVFMGHAPAQFAVYMGCSSASPNLRTNTCTCVCFVGSKQITRNCDATRVTVPAITPEVQRVDPIRPE